MIETRKMSYQKKIIKLFIFLVGIFLIGCSGDDGKDGMDGLNGLNGNTGPAAVLIVPDEIEDIQEAIDLISTNGGGTVYIRAGEYALSKGIHIKNSNITISGEQGTILTLEAGVNQPVILIGSDTETPSNTIENIKIESLEIDGNMAAQNSVTDPNRPWIRNNGIDVRAVNDLYLSELDIHHARSGGLVVSGNSSIIFIDKSSFHHNYFDGIALYASEDIQVSNFFCYDNQAAGLSLDNDLKYVMFSTGSIRNNGDVGIFARHSKELKFQDLLIADNQSHGCFLSHESMGTGTGVNGLIFNSCSFTSNDGYGFWLASPASESSKISTIGCLFSSNILDAVNLDVNGELYMTGCIFQ
ncbi:right-handed parallel beta-helix repeat-containing protein [Ancylomarina sp. YFZ004]